LHGQGSLICCCSRTSTLRAKFCMASVPGSGEVSDTMVGGVISLVLVVVSDLLNSTAGANPDGVSSPRTSHLHPLRLQNSRYRCSQASISQITPLPSPLFCSAQGVITLIRLHVPLRRQHSWLDSEVCFGGSESLRGVALTSAKQTLRSGDPKSLGWRKPQCLRSALKW
jgi:hypothetical protein